MSVKPIPEGFHTVTPFLCVKGVPQLIEFLKAAFSAIELMRVSTTDGHVMHAEVKIGDSTVMMGEAMGDCPVIVGSCYLYVPDVDATYQAAIKAGGVSMMEPANQFWGDRMAAVKDPTGNQWSIATHTEDVAPDELIKRAQAHQNE